MKHDEATRQEAMRRVRAGESRAQVAKDLGISHSIIGKWLMDAPTPTPQMDWFLYTKRAA